MIKIGLLSDTHGMLDERIFEHFSSCDEVWHAGDIGSLEVLNKLQAFKPLRAVWGNIDGHDIRILLPQHNRFMCENVKVWLTHIGGYPGKYDPSVRSLLYTDPPMLFICGHSHILRVMYDKKLRFLYMNPGAAGKFGIHRVRTLLRFVLDAGDIRDLEVVELGENG